MNPNARIAYENDYRFVRRHTRKSPSVWIFSDGPDNCSWMIEMSSSASKLSLSDKTKLVLQIEDHRTEEQQALDRQIEAKKNTPSLLTYKPVLSDTDWCALPYDGVTCFRYYYGDGEPSYRWW